MKGYILVYETLNIGSQPVSVATTVHEIECALAPTDPNVTASTVYETAEDAQRAIDAHRSDLQGDVDRVMGKLAPGDVAVTPSAPAPGPTEGVPTAATSPAENDAAATPAASTPAPSTPATDSGSDDDTGPAVDSDNDGTVDAGDLVVDPAGKRGRVISVTGNQVEIAYKSGKTATFALADLKTATPAK